MWKVTVTIFVFLIAVMVGAIAATYNDYDDME